MPSPSAWGQGSPVGAGGGGGVGAKPPSLGAFALVWELLEA